MAWIHVRRGDEIDAELAAIYDELGGEPDDNILRIHSLDPKSLRAHLALYLSAMKGTDTLPKSEREMIALVVSGINGCHY